MSYFLWGLGVALGCGFLAGLARGRDHHAKPDLLMDALLPVVAGIVWPVTLAMGLVFVANEVGEWWASRETTP